MTDRDLSEPLSALFNDVPDNYLTEQTPLLAHYTSIESMQKILASDEIWLANPLLMNDHEELRWGIMNGIDEFRNNEELQSYLRSTGNEAEFEFQLDWFFKKFDEEAFDIYLFCLAVHDPGVPDGKLSMWRGYGANGDGAAIVFDTSKAPTSDELPIVLGPVHYASREERLEWIKRLTAKFTSIIKAQNISGRHEFIQAVNMLFERLKAFSLYTKHIGFSEEQEWRLVYFPDRDQDGILKPFRHYVTSAKGVEPKLRIPLGRGSSIVGVSLEELVHSIILGPSHASILAERSVKRMLELIGKERLAAVTRASTIPFRRP